MKKIISSIISIIVMVMLAGVCLAASTGIVTGDNLRLRSKASTNSTAIDVLNKGTKVNILSSEGSFYKVSVGNQTGFLSKEYVQTNNSTTSNSTSSNSSNTNKTSENSKSQNNTNQTNTAKYSNTTNNDENTLSNVNNDAENNTDSSKTTTVDTWSEEIINKANTTNLISKAKLYVLPLLNSTELGELSSGTEVLLVSVNGKWAYVRTSSQSGWINKSLLQNQIVTVPQNY